MTTGRGRRETLASHKMTISSLAYYPNNLDPDLQAREHYHTHLNKVIEAASKLNIDIVGTFVGRDPYKTVEENLRSFHCKLSYPVLRLAFSLFGQRDPNRHYFSLPSFKYPKKSIH